MPSAVNDVTSLMINLICRLLLKPNSVTLAVQWEMGTWPTCYCRLLRLFKWKFSYTVSTFYRHRNIVQTFYTKTSSGIEQKKPGLVLVFREADSTGNRARAKMSRCLEWSYWLFVCSLRVMLQYLLRYASRTRMPAITNGSRSGNNPLCFIIKVTSKFRRTVQLLWSEKLSTWWCHSAKHDKLTLQSINQSINF